MGVFEILIDFSQLIFGFFGVYQSRIIVGSIGSIRSIIIRRIRVISVMGISQLFFFGVLVFAAILNIDFGFSMNMGS